VIGGPAIEKLVANSPRDGTRPGQLGLLYAFLPNLLPIRLLRLRVRGLGRHPRLMAGIRDEPTSTPAVVAAENAGSKRITTIRSEAVPILGSLQLRHHLFDVGC
jgi:hypothetical protein